MILIDIAVAEDDVVVAVVDAAFGLLAECIERLAQSVFALAALKQHRQLDCVKSLVAYVAQYIELGIGQNGMGQAHHLAIRLVGRENTGAHTTYIFRQRHDQRLADRVDGRVGNLRKLLAEVVEEHLRMAAQYSQRSVVAH